MKSHGILLLLILCVVFPAVGHAGQKTSILEAGSKFVALPSFCVAIGKDDPVDCKDDPKVRAAGCDSIVPPPQEWGALKPSAAVGICQKFKGDSAVRIVGCAHPIKQWYLVLLPQVSKQEIKVVKNKEEFRAYYAPIESGEEAISYIVALTNSFPLFNFPKKYFVYTPEETGVYTEKNPKPTETVQKKDGFEVRLFENKKCGCHLPELTEVNYFVTTDGNISELKRKTIWRADGRGQICVD